MSLSKPEFTFKECGKTCSKRSSLNKHKIFHESTQYPCIQCDNHFHTMWHLKRHKDIQGIPSTSVMCVALDWHYVNLKSQLINASNTYYGYLMSPFRTTDNSILSRIIHVAFTGRAQLLMKYLSLNISNILSLLFSRGLITVRSEKKY